MGRWNTRLTAGAAKTGDMGAQVLIDWMENMLWGFP
jgi:hypothetical protein